MDALLDVNPLLSELETSNVWATMKFERTLLFFSKKKKYAIMSKKKLYLTSL